VRSRLSGSGELEENLLKILSKHETSTIIKVTEDLSRKLTIPCFEDRVKYYDKKLNMK
jgi:hypothetical protein